MTEPMKVTLKFITALAAVFMSSCASTPQEPNIISEARSYSRDGHEAYCEGNLDAAKQAYGQALQQHHAIDDSAGIIRDLINLSVVSKASGNRSDAIECLDAIDRYVATLEASGGDISKVETIDGLLLEAAWMRAYLACDAGNTQNARAALAQATERHGHPDRKLAGRFLNLEARLALDDQE